jgi:hypothetical protein
LTKLPRFQTLALSLVVTFGFTSFAYAASTSETSLDVLTATTNNPGGVEYSVDPAGAIENSDTNNAAFQNLFPELGAGILPPATWDFGSGDPSRNLSMALQFVRYDVLVPISQTILPYEQNFTPAVNSDVLVQTFDPAEFVGAQGWANESIVPPPAVALAPPALQFTASLGTFGFLQPPIPVTESYNYSLLRQLQSIHGGPTLVSPLISNPEPATMLLFATGLAVVFFGRRGKQ